MKLRGDGSLTIPEGGEKAVRHLGPKLNHPHNRKWAESRILTTPEMPEEDKNNQERHFEILTIKKHATESSK